MYISGLLAIDLKLDKIDYRVLNSHRDVLHAPSSNGEPKRRRRSASASLAFANPRRY